jgi:hypothetical protein
MLHHHISKLTTFMPKKRKMTKCFAPLLLAVVAFSACSDQRDVASDTASPAVTGAEESLTVTPVIAPSGLILTPVTHDGSAADPVTVEMAPVLATQEVVLEPVGSD